MRQVIQQPLEPLYNPAGCVPSNPNELRTDEYGLKVGNINGNEPQKTGHHRTMGAATSGIARSAPDQAAAPTG